MVRKEEHYLYMQRIDTSLKVREWTFISLAQSYSPSLYLPHVRLFLQVLLQFILENDGKLTFPFFQHLNQHTFASYFNKIKLKKKLMLSSLIGSNSKSIKLCQIFKIHKTHQKIIIIIKSHQLTLIIVKKFQCLYGYCLYIGPTFYSGIKFEKNK